MWAEIGMVSRSVTSVSHIVPPVVRGLWSRDIDEQDLKSYVDFDQLRARDFMVRVKATRLGLDPTRRAMGAVLRGGS